MIPSHLERSNGFLAGLSCQDQQLVLHEPNQGDKPLVDTANNMIDPRKAALRRDADLSERYPDPAEPWCNCTD